MLIKRPNDVLPSEITDESVYLKRRELLKRAGLVTAGAMAGHSFLLQRPKRTQWSHTDGRTEKSTSARMSRQTPGVMSPRITTTMNLAQVRMTHPEMPVDFKPRPWSVAVKGACEKPGNYNYEDLVSPHVLEERIYRLRCVEAWSMVVPWVGIPLASMIKQFEPNSKAKYVRFKTLHDPKRMPGQRRGSPGLAL